MTVRRAGTADAAAIAALLAELERSRRSAAPVVAARARREGVALHRDGALEFNRGIGYGRVSEHFLKPLAGAGA